MNRNMPICMQNSLIFSVTSALCRIIRLAKQDIVFGGSQEGSPSGKPKSKKDNPFRQHLLARLQGIFEEKEDIHKTKKKPEEMDEEERGKYYNDKKKKILGS